MDKRLNSTKLYEKGAVAMVDTMKAHGDTTDPLEALGVAMSSLLYGVAIMLDEAINGPKRAAKREPKKPLPFDGPALHKHLREHAPQTFVYDVIDRKWWARLNKQIRDLGDLPDDALDRFAAFCRTGAFGAWKKKTGLPFEYVVQNFKPWMSGALASNAELTPSAPNTRSVLDLQPRGR